MSGQSLIFCVGAAKSGTSWLHDYLQSHDEVYLRNLKELHYFNALDGGGNKWHRNQMIKRLAEHRARLEVQERPEDKPHLQQLVRDLEEWLGLFDGETPVDQGYLDYVGYGRKKARLVGDFTPAYALLSEKMMAHMAGLARRVKFIFLMREPVERLWSNIRMNVGKRGPKALQREIATYLAGDNRNLSLRSNYQRTLRRLQAVLPAANLHVEFYERLFTPEAIERLCAFLGLAPKQADFGRVVHGGRKSSLDAGLRQQLQASLAPQYEYIDRNMGGLPHEWTDRMVSA